ncbi:MAG: hypothetical protein WCE57_07415, partial [Salegentibacter sp.]
ALADVAFLPAAVVFFVPVLFFSEAGVALSPDFGLAVFFEAVVFSVAVLSLFLSSSFLAISIPPYYCFNAP